MCAKRSVTHYLLLDAEAENASGEWFDAEGASKAILNIVISGTITVEIVLDPLRDGVTRLISLGTFTESAQKVLDDPVGRIQANSSDADAGSSAVVDMFLVS